MTTNIMIIMIITNTVLIITYDHHHHHDHCNFDDDIMILLSRALGQGAFGEVYQGLFKKSQNGEARSPSLLIITKRLLCSYLNRTFSKENGVGFGFGDYDSDRALIL